MSAAFIVVDASVVAIALIGRDASGVWARGVLRAGQLAAPSILPVEVANVLRKQVLAGKVSDDHASLAHAQLLQLPITFAAYDLYGARTWALRANVRPYDAWYVALAEQLQAPLATLDLRLKRASGPTCRFLVPPVQSPM